MTTPNQDIPAPDLTKRPPRSPRNRLGGYVLLPRMLDKGRADITGKIGEYKYNWAALNLTNDTVGGGGVKGDYQINQVVGGLSFHF